MIQRVIGRLINRIEELQSIVNQLDRRINNVVREGMVTEIDLDKGMVKVDTNGIVSRPMPWVQRAGAIREWSPPTKGERVVIISPTGDPGNGLVVAGGFSDEFPQNHNEGGVHRMSVGDVQLDHSADGFFISAGGVTFSFTGSGFAQTGGEQSHDGKDVGVTHKHSDVTPGGGNTGTPI